MSILLSLDPGIRGCGVALFDKARLYRAAYVKNPVKAGGKASESASMAHTVRAWAISDSLVRTTGYPIEIAVEWPQVYATQIRKGASKGDPNDLLALCGVDSAVVALLGAPATSYAPREWKGQIPKEAHHARIRNRLNADELGYADAGAAAAKSLAHNLWDAIGIGLHHLGRLERVRVIPQ